MNTRVYTASALLLAVLSGVAFVGCSGAQKPTGADLVDKQRDGALAVFVNRKVTDQLDADSGDNVDWKYVDISAQGDMEVTVAFDSPEKVKGEVVLRDNFATVLERHRITADRSVYAFTAVKARPSRYYIEIAADNGGSVYTVGVDLTEPNVAGFGSQDDGFNRVAIDSGGRRVGTGKKPAEGGSTPPNNTPTEVVQDPPPTEEKPTEEKPAEGTSEPTDYTVAGYVVRVIPVDGGGTLLHIQLRGAKFELVRAGLVGTINQLGATVTVRQRNGSFVTAVTNAEAEDCKIHKNITFNVKE